jgi:hypothetical protein
MHLSVRRLAAATATLCLTAGTTVLLATAPASANVCSPWPGCFGVTYHVTGTPANSPLDEWSGNPNNGGRILGTVPNNTPLTVACQANNGPQEDGQYNIYPTVPSRTWDFVWDGTNNRFAWVYDWYMSTPPQAARFNWYSWAEYKNPDGSESYCNF